MSSAKVFAPSLPKVGKCHDFVTVSAGYNRLKVKIHVSLRGTDPVRDSTASMLLAQLVRTSREWIQCTTLASFPSL